MFDHAKNLEFEKAARVRDQLALLKEQVFGSGGSTNVVSADACGEGGMTGMLALDVAAPIL